MVWINPNIDFHSIYLLLFFLYFSLLIFLFALFIWWSIDCFYCLQKLTLLWCARALVKDTQRRLFACSFCCNHSRSVWFDSVRFFPWYTHIHTHALSLATKLPLVPNGHPSLNSLTLSKVHHASISIHYINWIEKFAIVFVTIWKISQNTDDNSPETAR